jgi:carbon-monoxide dehydrogenase small subunit
MNPAPPTTPATPTSATAVPAGAVPVTEVAVAVTVNGVAHEVHVEVRRSLADTLREDLGLTGTHLGCEHGVCGSCTVLLDGAPVRSCLVLAVQAAGRTVTTIEGLADGDELHPVQQGCLERHAFQCGFCTPGMVVTAAAFLVEHPDPDEGEVREALSGNLCRCTGYQSIVAGVLRGAELARQQAGTDPLAGEG